MKLALIIASISLQTQAIGQQPIAFSCHAHDGQPYQAADVSMSHVIGSTGAHFMEVYVEGVDGSFALSGVPTFVLKQGFEYQYSLSGNLPNGKIVTATLSDRPERPDTFAKFVVTVGQGQFSNSVRFGCRF